MAQRLKRLPPLQETRVQSLGWEDPLEKEMAIHSSTIAWKIPWTEEPGRLHVVHGVAKSRTRLSGFTSLHFTLQLHVHKKIVDFAFHFSEGIIATIVYWSKIKNKGLGIL